MAVAARPAVALRLGIDTGHYHNRLGDATLRLLEAALIDSVRSRLQKSYPHLNWNAGGAATDTVELRVANRPPKALSQSELQFRIRGPERRMLKDAVSIEFEKYPTIPNRIDWAVDSVRRQWLTTIDTLIKNPNLLTDVFGRVPFIANVSFNPADLIMNVPVDRNDLGRPGERPVFSIRGKIRDPGTSSNDWAELRLRPCKAALTGAGLTCQLERVDYPGQRIFILDSLRALVARATLDSTRILVTGFEGIGTGATPDAPIPPEDR